MKKRKLRGWAKKIGRIIGLPIILTIVVVYILVLGAFTGIVYLIGLIFNIKDE